MNKLNFHVIKTTLHKATQECVRMAASFFQYLMQLSLPAVLVVCIGCALLLSILPLALTLFAAFLVCKLLAFIVAPNPVNKINQ